MEKPVVVTKYVDKPYPVETRIPYSEEKLVDKRLPYPIEVPIGVKIPYQGDKNNIKVPYNFEKPQDYYNYGYQRQQIQNVPIYQQYTVEHHKQGIPPPHLYKNQVRNDQSLNSSHTTNK